MTAELVRIPGTVAPDAGTDIVAVLRQVLAAADDRAAELYDAGDIDRLAHGLHALRPILRDLNDLVRRVEDHVADLMPDKVVELDGLPPMERRRGTDRKAWDSDDLLRDVVRTVSDLDTTTGELRVDPDRLLTVLRQVVPFTGSLSWRVVALRDLGLDPDEYCTTSPGRVSVQFHEAPT
jgi:hypothetical protein